MAEQKLQNRLAQLEEAQTGQREVIEERWFGPRPVAYLRREIPLDEDLELPIRELERQNRLEAAMFLGRWGWQSAGGSPHPPDGPVLRHLCVLGRAGAGGGANLPCGIGVFGSSVWRGSSGCGVLLPADAGLSIGAGYRLAGDSVEIALIDGGITGDEAQFVTELQIPFSR